MAIFHFFTDTDLITQTPVSPLDPNVEIQYGPYLTEIADSGTHAGQRRENFRLCSLHQSSGASPNVYAVCDGLLIAQEISGGGTDRLNLIVRPTEQPAEVAGVRFPKIRYFIYRGVRKDSLLAGGQILPDNDSNSKDLTKQIQKDFAGRGDTGSPGPEQIGLQHGASHASGEFSGSDSIDNLFDFSKTDPTFSHVIVKSGETLGKFDKSGFGLEIILESVIEPPLLDTVRQLDHTIYRARTTYGASQDPTFINRNSREIVLGYLDPCA
ncbi:MAG: hypothetical protein AAF570_03125, partial [Bacteroidota bacterium]